MSLGIFALFFSAWTITYFPFFGRSAIAKESGPVNLDKNKKGNNQKPSVVRKTPPPSSEKNQQSPKKPESSKETQNKTAKSVIITDKGKDKVKTTSSKNSIPSQTAAQKKPNSENVQKQPSQRQPASPPESQQPQKPNSENVQKQPSQGQPASPPESQQPQKPNSENVQKQPSQRQPASPPESQQPQKPNSENVQKQPSQRQPASPPESQQPQKPNSENVQNEKEQTNQDPAALVPEITITEGNGEERRNVLDILPEGLKNEVQSKVSEIYQILSEYKYDAESPQRPNPFAPYQDPSQPMEAEKQIHLTPAEMYDLSDMKLIGIKWGKGVGVSKALFRSPDQIVHNLQKNDRIGSNRGIIYQLREDEVVILEPRVDVDQDTYVPVVIPLDRWKSKSLNNKDIPIKNEAGS